MLHCNISAEVLIDGAAAVAVCDPKVFTEPQILLARQGDQFQNLIMLISRSKIHVFPADLGAVSGPGWQVAQGSHCWLEKIKNSKICAGLNGTDF